MKASWLTCRALAATVAFATLCAEASAQTAAPPGDAPVRPVTVSGRLVRDTVTLGKTILPAWKVELVYVNTSKQPWELGESLFLIAPSSAGGAASVHVSRAPAEPGKAPKYVADRYRMTWGLNIPSKGSAIWPFTALREINKIEALMLSLQARRVDALPGSGYGAPLQPGETRTISEQLVFPFNAEVKGLREAIVIVPPVVRPAGTGLRPAPSMLVFDVKGIVASGTAFEVRSTDVLPNDAPALRGIANDVLQPAWRRLQALNFLVDTYPAETSETLIALAGDTSPSSVMRTPAILNMGLLKTPGALPVLVKLVETGTGATRVAAIAALGDLGDPAAAPAVRTLLRDKDEQTASYAIRTVGTLKDLDSLPLLITALHDNRRTLYETAGAAIVAMDNQVARDALINVFRNRKAPEPTRTAVASTLGAARAPWATEAAVSVLLDEQEEDDVRLAVVQTLRINRSSDGDAAIEKAAASRKKKVKEAATSAVERFKKDAASKKSS
ncbi:MAG TPA: HEAT repeat domain-containing protein [Vicinamibacterales bacterium]